MIGTTPIPGLAGYWPLTQCRARGSPRAGKRTSGSRIPTLPHCAKHARHACPRCHAVDTFRSQDLRLNRRRKLSMKIGPALSATMRILLFAIDHRVVGSRRTPRITVPIDSPTERRRAFYGAFGSFRGGPVIPGNSQSQSGRCMLDAARRPRYRELINRAHKRSSVQLARRFEKFLTSLRTL